MVGGGVTPQIGLGRPTALVFIMVVGIRQK